MSYDGNLININKVDTPLAFQRTGKFPLDRSSLFSSYADALKYAKQDGTDGRVLGGTSYIGQIISVYDITEGNEEISAYIITGVGESAELTKLAQSNIEDGNVDEAINKLQAQLASLGERVTILEGKPDTNTTYTFSTSDDTDGAIKISAYNKDGELLESPKTVQVKGWEELEQKVEGAVATAEGRVRAFVYANKQDNSYTTDIQNPDKYKKGDVIYFTDTNIPDEWVVGILPEVNEQGSHYEFSILETQKVDLTDYYTKTEVDNSFALKSEVNTKANQSDLTALQATVTNNKTAVDTSIQTIESKLGEVKTNADTGEIISLQSQIDNIDVSGQINSKINDLKSELKSDNGSGGTTIGGAERSYITSIKQEDGKIYASASVLPDYDSNAQDKADKALEDAKSYVDGKIGDLPEDKTVVTYVDSKVETEINAVNTTINTNVIPELEALKPTVSGHTTKIGEIETTIGNHATSIGNLETEINSVKTRVTNVETAVQNAGKVNSVSIHYKDNNDNVYVESITPGADKVLNFANGISTDWLTQGNHTLVLDCGSANQ